MAIVASWLRLLFVYLRRLRCGDGLLPQSRSGLRKPSGIHIMDYPTPLRCYQLALLIAGEVKDEETTLGWNPAQHLARRKYAKSVVPRESRIAIAAHVPSKRQERIWRMLLCSATQSLRAR